MVIAVYIGMGCNLGDCMQTLRLAKTAMKRLSVDQCITSSPIYQTQPIGDFPDQPDYLNGVCGFKTRYLAHQLLHELQKIEQDHHRQQQRISGQARTLDLDILLYGESQFERKYLHIPHPRMHERHFVLKPLFDIAGNIRIPGKGPIAPYLKRCTNQRLSRVYFASAC